MNNQEIWIKKGYEIFANQGSIGLKIESLAKLVGKSKSSFYHYFVDLDIFIDILLEYHLEQSKIIAIKEKNAKNIDPELIDILITHKTDLLFNRQLRINQNITKFYITLNRANIEIGDGFLTIWAKELNSNFNNEQLESMLAIAIDNFYLQINSENINYEWLSKYFANLKKITNKF